MNTCFKKFFTVVFITLLINNLVIIQVPINTFGFGNKSHEQLSELAFHKVLFDLGLTKYIEATADLVRHSTGPDRDEDYAKEGWRTGGKRGGWYEGHFFNVETDLEKEDTALTRMINHFNDAVALARSNDWRKSIYDLARALHYLQDMCCPVHMWGYRHNNIPAMVTLHIELENYWDAMFDSENLLEHIPRGSRFLPVSNFENIRCLGICAASEALSLHRDWIEKNTGIGIDILQSFNTINPVYWIGRLASRAVDHHGKENTGFRRRWQGIFHLPYLASYELIRMWAESVSDFTFPAPGCIIQ